MIIDFQLVRKIPVFYLSVRDIGPHGRHRTPWGGPDPPQLVHPPETYTVYCVRWDTYFQANRVEHQKLNQRY